MSIPLVIKAGVRTLGMRPQLLLVTQSALGIWESLGAPELVVTSVVEGQHSHSSEHYKGDAIDLRIRNIPGPEANKKISQAAQRLSVALGDDFDVVLEPTHVHVEYDPKKPY